MEGSVAAGGRDPRVLVVIDRLQDIGGAEGSTALIVDGLQGHGVEFATLALVGYDLAHRSEIESRGTRFFPPPGARLDQQVNAVRSAIRSYRPDLVHATLARSELVSRVAGRLARAPVMTSIVNMQYSEEARRVAPSARKLDAYRRLDGFLARHATFWFHAISQATADAAVESLCVDAQRITIVPRGRDDAALGRRTPERRAAARSQLGIPADVPVLLNVGRHEHQKGQLYLVDALPAILDVAPDTLVLVAGREGTSTAALTERIHQLGVADHVRLLGQRSDIAALMCAADVFVFPSLYEGLGGALIEAMALEAPIVAFDVPAVRETVGRRGPPRAGPRCPPPGRGVPQPAHVADVADDLRARGRRRFETTFTNERYLAGMRSLYHDVAARAR